MLHGRVEPYGPGAWKFFCECGGEQAGSTRPIGCSRIVNDSEPNFNCERPIVDAKDTRCKFKHQLWPLVQDYMERKAKEDAAAYLATLETKKQEALKTLGLTEAQYNAQKGGTITKSTSVTKES